MVPKLKLPKFELSPLKQATFVFREVVKLLWQAESRFFLVMVLGRFLVGLISFPSLILEKLFLDALTTGVANHTFNTSIRIIGIVVVARTALTVLRGIISRISNYAEFALEIKFYNLLSRLTASKYSSLEIPLIEDPNFKDRYTKIIRTTGNRAFRIASLFSEIPGFVSRMISSMGIFLFIQFWILPVVILFAIPTFLVNSKLSKKRYELESILSPIYRFRGRIEYWLTQSTKYLELRLLQISDYLNQKYIGYQGQIFQARAKLNRESMQIGFFASLPEMIFSNVLNFYAGFLALVGRVTIGSAFVFARAVSDFDTNLGGLVRNVADLYENYLYISDLVWLLNLPSKSNTAGRHFPKKIAIGIKFDHVWFKYPGSDNWIVKDLSIDIGPRKNIALIGENGAGKSTLIKLLCGFYLPDRGSITIDGISVNQFSRDQYWKNISVMFQEFENYAFTARENIGYGNISKVSDLKFVKKYAQLADVDEWIMSLPMKYENPLSRDFEKGINPSGGQMQKIGIARTLIRESGIIVLDEPTSNVDPKTEEEIFDKIIKLVRNKILVLISHRFSTVRRADDILVMDHGQISEKGSHEELMKSQGTYAKLFTLQAKSYQ